MARGSRAYRSAATGRYVTKRTATMSPRTTVSETRSKRSHATAYRSAITGRYVTKGTAQRHPDTTVTENG